MITLFPRHVLTLVLTALAAVFALPERLLAAPVTDHPGWLLRSPDFPALRARMNDSNDLWSPLPAHVVMKAPAREKRTLNASDALIIACSYGLEADGALKVPAAN